MKRMYGMVACVLAVVLLAGCGGGQRVVRTSEEYRQMVMDARPAELNEIPGFTVLVPEDGAEPGFDTSDYEALDEAQQKQLQRYNLHGMVFYPTNGFVEEDMESYAMSIGTLITQAYGVAIIMPKEGREEAVLQQVKNFVQMQADAQKTYLQDQYAIAKAAVVRTAPTGEVLLAMCEGAEAVMAAMEEALKV